MKSVEDRIVTSNALLKIFDSMNIGILTADFAEKIVFSNKFALEMLSAPTTKIIGEQVSNIWKELGNIISQCLSEKRPITGEFLIYKNKRYIANAAFVNGQKKNGDILCTFQREEGMVLSRKAIDRHEFINKQLNAILNSSSDGLWICDAEGKVLNVNKSSEVLSGIKSEDVIGRTISELVENGLFSNPVTLKVMKSEKKETVLAYGKRTQRHLLLTGTPTFDKKNKLSLIIVNERDITELNSLRKELEEAQTEKEKIKDELNSLNARELRQHEIIADSPKMKQVLNVALRLSQFEQPNILLLGESGTGKSLLAKWIHNNGKNRKNTIMQINCAAFPDSLLEAELFGYEKGAFTGADHKGKAGLLELAHEGTLFLDEIGDLALPLQAKLLKYLDDRKVMRLGGVKSKKTNCTITAATNRDLKELIKEKKFRQDLFYRLNTFTIRIPALRDRSEDIFGLTNFFLNKYNRRYKLNRRLSSKGFRILQNYSFPGNIRELENIINQAVAMSESKLIDKFVSTNCSRDKMKTTRLAEINMNKDFTEQVMAFEKKLLQEAMKSCKSTRELSFYLGITQTKVVRRMKKYNLSYM